MGSDENFYEGSKGSDYNLSKDYGETFIGNDYRAPSSNFALTTLPNTANQIREISAKLNTGAKNVEITALQPELFEAIPEQHLKEINRLKKITGIDLTLHAPLIEASGVTDRGVDESRRVQAERQIDLVLKRAHTLDPDGNVVITFHTTSGLPEMKVREMVEKNGKREERVNEMLVINERDGQITTVKSKPNFLEGKSEQNPQDMLNEFNDNAWTKELTQLSFHAHNGQNSIAEALRMEGKDKLSEDLKDSSVMDIYKKYNTVEGQKIMNEKSEVEKGIIRQVVNTVNYGDIYVRDAYKELQDMFNKAWDVVQKKGTEEDRMKMEEFQKRISKRAKDFKDPKNLPELATEVLNGTQLLSTLSTTPKVYTPLQDFVIDKSSETFSNAAIRSYQDKKGNAPIISLENPPAGQMGLGTGEDVRALVEATRKKFVEKAVSELGMSKRDAEKQAEKQIGATWDVGHINMLKKHGYSDKDILKETEKVAKYVKHLHLSDNFGFEHTELPMGMGNVPMAGHLKKLKEQFGDKVDKIKKVIETGSWYQHFQTTPFKKTMEAFGSPIYGMKMAPYWNQAAVASQNYFSGYGQMLPEGNFSMYGAGFSSLPTELGGQVGGGRGRLSGNPME